MAQQCAEFKLFAGTGTERSAGDCHRAPVVPGRTPPRVPRPRPRFIKALKKRKKIPEGGGITSILMHWELRLPGGEVFIPWHVTGYGWRVNTAHLIMPTLEKWLAIARAFAHQTNRRTGMITKGKALVLSR